MSLRRKMCGQELERKCWCSVGSYCFVYGKLHLFEDITHGIWGCLKCSLFYPRLVTYANLFLLQEPISFLLSGTLPGIIPHPKQTVGGMHIQKQTKTYRLTGVHIHNADGDKRRPDPVMNSASHLSFPKRYLTLVALPILSWVLANAQWASYIHIHVSGLCVSTALPGHEVGWGGTFYATSWLKSKQLWDSISLYVTQYTFGIELSDPYPVRLPVLSHWEFSSWKTGLLSNLSGDEEQDGRG